MDQPGLSPVIPDDAPTRPTAPRWRWWVHLLIFTAYPIVLGVLGAIWPPGQGPLLPSEPLRLAAGVGNEVLIFAVVFALAWSASRASKEALRVNWTSGVRPVSRGLFYGMGLQITVMLGSIVIRALVAIAGGHMEALDKLQPEYERIVDPQQLASKPLYLWMNVTLVSFVMGGLREELWRSGMLAGLAGVAPRAFGTSKGQAWAVCIAATCFGLGHMAQGWGGVIVTSILGVALGMIMIWHRTIWTAVFAHGFFDAASFFLIYLAAKYFPEQLHKLG